MYLNFFKIKICKRTLIFQLNKQNPASLLMPNKILVRKSIFIKEMNFFLLLH